MYVCNMIEIERKFLVNGDFLPFAIAHHNIEQGYLCTESGRTVRVRLNDGKGFLTIKGRTDAKGMSRFEWEQEIDAADARTMLDMCGDRTIVKTRHIVPSEDGRHTWEVDEFHGRNSGLIVAEIELGSEDEDFPLPGWIGREVTGNRAYYNSALLSGNPDTAK